jgi:hypothetical protein
MTKLQAGHSLEVKAFLTMNRREDNHDNDVGNALFLMMSSEGCTTPSVERRQGWQSQVI